MGSSHGDNGRSRRLTVLAASAGGMWVVGLGGYFFGFAYYGDDTPDQVWQFDVGVSVGLVGLALAVLLTIAAALVSAFAR